MKNEIMVFLNKDDVNIYLDKRKENMNVSLDDFIVDLKSKKILINKPIGLRKKIIIILEDEEIVIRNLSLPSMPRKKISSVLNYKLKSEFGDSLKLIEFSYKIIKEDDKNINIIMYCINRTGMDKIVKNCKNKKIKAIHIIQEYFADIVMSLINDVAFSVVYYYKNYYFYDQYDNGILIRESRIRDDEILDCGFSSFINTCNQNNKLYDLYTINIEEKNLKGVSPKINIINLGFYDRRQLIFE
ncbi:hypothetical protein [Clostridium sp. DL1XJH146]